MVELGTVYCLFSEAPLIQGDQERGNSLPATMEPARLRSFYLSGLR